MADEKIKYSDLFEGDIFDPAVKGAEALLKRLDELEGRYKAILKETKKVSSSTPFNDIESISEREKAIAQNTEAVKRLNKIEAEREKLEKRLKLATDARAEANATLKIQIQDATRRAKENARIEGAVGPYKAKSALLTKLRNQYKDIALSQGVASESAQRLLKQVKELDDELKDLDKSVGQSQRKVGDYEGALESLNRAVESVENRVDKLGNSLRFLQKIGIVTALLELVNVFKSSEKGAQTFDKVLLRLSVTLTIFVDSLAGAFEKTGNIFDNLGKAFDNFGERVSKALKAGDALIDSEVRIARETALLQRELESLIKSQAEFEIAADDSTLSLNEQAEALDALEKAATAILNKQIEVAKQEEKIAQARRDQSARLRGDGKADAEAEQQLTDAILSRAEAEGELTRFVSESAQRRREISRDSAELELDILIDAADNLKTIRERQIADETLNVRTRRALLDQTEKDINDSFDNQIAVIEGIEAARLRILVNEKIALRERKEEELKALEEIDKASKQDIAKKKKLSKEINDLKDKEAEIGKKAVSIIIDSNNLISASDTETLNKRIKALELDEITQTRLLEVVKERRTALQDLSETNKDLTESERELREQTGKNLLTTEALFALQKEGVSLQKVLNKLSEDTLDLEIEALQKRILNGNLVSTELARLQGELNDKLLSRQTQRIEKQLEAEKRFNDQVIALTKSLVDKRAEEQNKAIDREISAQQERTQALQALARQGVESASDNLALAQKREAELEQKRSDLAKRQAREQLVLSVFETYSNKVAAGDTNPVVNTITDIATLQAFVASLPAFWGGAENVADSIGAPNFSTGRDGYLARFDGGERIMTVAQNKMIGAMSNNELARIAQEHRLAKDEVSSSELEAKLLLELKELNAKPVYLGRGYEATERAIIDVVMRKGKIEKTHRKTGGFW